MRCSEDKVVYYLDEGLPDYVADWMKKVGLAFEAVKPSTPDHLLIRTIGECRHRGVWITQDLGSRREHRSLILNQGISVAWIKCGNATRLKKAFLVFSFAYRFKRHLELADAPLYFEVREIRYGGKPSAVVSVQTKL